MATENLCRSLAEIQEIRWSVEAICRSMILSGKGFTDVSCQNWSPKKKWTIFAVMIYGTFCGISTAVANVLATPEQAEDWQVTSNEAAYSV